jgi:hypothetical protein
VSDKHAAPTEFPFVTVFGLDVGVFEFELRTDEVVIGRSRKADLRLSNPSVSRQHARIARADGQYTLTDMRSTSGTAVNGRSTAAHVLQHGDSIQIGPYVLLYHTQRVETAAAVALQARSLLRADYCALPSTMKAKFRVLDTSSSVAFDSCSTLRIEQGGLLIPVSTPPEGAACLELLLSVTRHTDKRFLGEVMGSIEEGGTHWMCVKLHAVTNPNQTVIVAGANPGPWVTVAAD